MNKDEKGIPKEPIWHQMPCESRICGFYQWKTCPTCGAELIYIGFCHKCGQKIKIHEPKISFTKEG